VSDLVLDEPAPQLQGLRRRVLKAPRAKTRDSRTTQALDSA
jgi:hypothetical protein